MKIGYQLKQVRERLAKGLVDKGILRTEKRNFLLFDMATHPVVDSGAKEEIRRRVRNMLTQRTVVLGTSQWLPENLEFRHLRTVAMVCAAYAANVLENALSTLGHEAREKAFNQTDELLADYSQWPFGRKATGNDIGENLPQVIAEVRTLPSPVMAMPSFFPLRLHLLTRDRCAGNQQGPGQGAPARSRGRLSERLHPPRLPPLNRGARTSLPIATSCCTRSNPLPDMLAPYIYIYLSTSLSPLRTAPRTKSVRFPRTGPHARTTLIHIFRGGTQVPVKNASANAIPQDEFAE